MNIRCLIGHDYGDPQTSHEREERGDEVVVTAVEYRECSRCGDRRIVSENKEVTSIETESADADAPVKEEKSQVDAREERRAPEYEDVSAEEDDGIILEDDAETEERERGEWPAGPTDDGEDAEGPREWPDVGGEDEGYAATAADGDPVGDVEFGGGLAPDSGPAHPDEAGGEEGGEGERTGTPADAPDPSPTRRRPSGADTEFVCPECGHTVPPEGSSLRPGDICPECREGYIAERETAAGE